MEWEAYQSMMAQVPFLREEFSSMVGNGKFVLLHYLVAKQITGLRISPPGVKEELYIWPRCISNYIYSSINAEYFPIAALSIMQYGWALDLIVRQVVISGLDLVPIYLLKVDVSNGFFSSPCSHMIPQSWAQFLPLSSNVEDMVNILITLSMGWKNSHHYNL